MTGSASAAPGSVVDVIVAVHDAQDDVQRCLTSVLRHSDASVRLIVINDASGPACTAWLRQVATESKRVLLLEQEQNCGYTRSANAGLRASTAPHLVLLNSDTIVSAGWLDGLLRCANSSPEVGIVGPLSNAASWQSVPRVLTDDGQFAINELPEGFDVDALAELVRQTSLRAYPATPFLNGFCLLLKRRVVERIGLFDPAHFPIGYGEENDYCIRASDAGFELRVADDVYVHHAKSRSFGSERRAELARVGQESLKQKHGRKRVEALMQQVRHLPELERARAAVSTELSRATAGAALDPLTLKVLFLLPERGSGGGIHSIIQEASGMRRMGVRAQVGVRPTDRRWYLDAYAGTPQLDELLVSLDTKALLKRAGDFDAVVATSYASVELLAKLHAENAGPLPAYYVQDYEPFFFEEGSARRAEARATYERIPGALHFAKTDWLVRTLAEQHGLSAQRVVPSLDHEIYYPAPKTHDGPLRIAAMIRPQTARRNAPLTMRVLSEVVRRHPGRVEAHLFGCSTDREEFQQLSRDFPFVNYGALKRAEVASLLRDCHVFADLSSYQAFGRTALEAMACGCAVVVPSAGGASEYAEDGVNALVVDTRDAEACVAALEGLIGDDERRRRLARAGLATASGFSIDEAAVSELNVLARAVAARAGHARVRRLSAPKRASQTDTIAAGTEAAGAPQRPEKQSFPVAESATMAIRRKIRSLAAATPSPRPLLAPTNHMSDNKLVRKMKKLVERPDAFFADSANPAVKQLGVLWKKREALLEKRAAAAGQKAADGQAEASKPAKAAPAKSISPLVQRAGREARSGNLHGALDLYSQAAGGKTTDQDALAGEAGCRFWLGQYELAEELFEKLAAASPGTPAYRRGGDLCRAASAGLGGVVPDKDELLAVLEPVTHKAVRGWLVDRVGKSSVTVRLYVDGNEVARKAVQLGSSGVKHGLGFVDFAFALSREVCDGAEHEIAIGLDGQRHRVLDNAQRRVLSGLKLGEFTLAHGYARGALLPQAFPVRGGRPPEQAQVDVYLDTELLRSLTVKFNWENAAPQPAFFSLKLPRTASDGQRHELRMMVPELATELRTTSGEEAFVFQDQICGQVDSIKDGLLSGWVFDNRDSKAALEVSLFDGDHLISRKLTSLQRADVNRIFGIEGTHGFTFHVPTELFDGKQHQLRVCVGSVRLPSSVDEQAVTPVKADLLAAEGRFQGKVEVLTPERVSGWAVDLMAPYRPVHVSISVDGVIVATELANQFRARLQDAGKGSGNHLFDVALPTRLMNGKKAKVEVSISESFGKAIIGGGTVSFSLVDFFGNRPLSMLPKPRLTRNGSPSSRILRSEKPTLSLIVLNLDGDHLLPELFASMTRVAWGISFEVILVDHGSIDDSLAIAESYKEQLPLQIVRRNANYSFSASNNHGVALARGEFVAFLNNDIVFLDDCLSGLCANLSDPTVGLVGLRLVEPLLTSHGVTRLTPHHLGVKFAPSLAAGAAHGKVYLPVEVGQDDALPPGCYDVPAVTAALSVCRKSDFQAVGGFDEGYFYGMEDMDLCHKFSYQLGKRIVCDTRLSALHQRSATRNRPSTGVETSSTRPSAVQNRERYVHRFGRKLTREVLGSLIAGSSRHRDEPLQVTFSVTEANASTPAGDFFTAVELGEALRQELGYKVMFLPKGNYEVPGTDVLIAMRHDFDVRKIAAANPGLIMVAWIRNRVDQWLATEQLDAYHLILCSSQGAIDEIREQCGREAELFPIATNEDRFRPMPSQPQYAADVTFTGHYWGQDRDGLELLNPENINGSLAIFGKEWSKCPAWHAHWRGQVPYVDLPSVYSSAGLVIDDSHPVTRRWGSLNSRVFDALGSGKLVLTNCRSGAHSLFGDRLPTFESSNELEALINHYLAVPEEREALASKLREEVLSAHTYKHRARTLQQSLRQMVDKQLRFAIKVPIPKPENKQRWGDYHFALGIQRALQARGHLARIDLLPDWKSGLSVSDDVVLVLRGLSAYEPSPRSLNLMWLISHPTDVAYSEYEKFDHVFVASSSFAGSLSSNLNVPVSTLLQCTDPSLFSAQGPAPDAAVPEVLFVGNSRNQERRIIRDCIEANIDVGVYGAMWERFLPKQLWRGTHISNRDLRGYYATAKVVLNDHWPDMARHGFVSNRIFDAGACNAAIVSDPVTGLEELFGDLVSTYDTPDQLSRLVERLRSDDAGRAARGARLGEIIRRQHTFEQRVDEILRVAQGLLAHEPRSTSSNGVKAEDRATRPRPSSSMEDQP